MLNKVQDLDVDMVTSGCSVCYGYSKIIMT